jgi:hypothetical protein
VFTSYTNAHIRMRPYTHTRVTGTKVLQKCKLLVLKYFDKPGSCYPTQSLWTPDIVERCTHTPCQLVSSTMHSFCHFITSNLPEFIRNSSEMEDRGGQKCVCVCVCVCVCIHTRTHQKWRIEEVRSMDQGKAFYWRSLYLAAWCTVMDKALFRLS